MESITQNPLFEYHPNTLHNVRKLYGLDSPEMVVESVNRLQEWIQKQKYFNKKDYSRDYLEKIIIGTKGSVERAKERLEKICMLRTIAPIYFGQTRANEILGLDRACIDVVLPKLTKDYYRVYIVKGLDARYDNNTVYSYCKRLVLVFEYWMKYDYAKGVVAIIDGRDTNMMDMFKIIATSESRNNIHMFFECYVARLQAMHVLVSSKIISSLFPLLKAAYSPKVYQRFHFHNSLEALHQKMEKDILPLEYGGKEKPMKELQQKWIDVLSTDEFMDTMKEMQTATIDTNVKSTEDFSGRYNLGLAGTFRKLNVD